MACDLHHSLFPEATRPIADHRTARQTCRRMSAKRQTQATVEY
eukprot:SAG31_NODE_28762_length_405_cov_1.016340_1_plen_42_part_10